MKRECRRLIVASLFVLAWSVVGAAPNKVPVDPLTLPPGEQSYDPMTPPTGASPPGWYVQPAETAADRQTQAFSPQSAVIATGATIGALMRWPAGGRPERPMVNATAYYRDAFTGIRFTAHASRDGDTWTVKAEYPVEDGSSRTLTTTWPNLRYYEQIGGFYDCWYSPGWLYYICGVRSLVITAYRLSQCDPAGTWIMRIYENGTQVGGDQPFIMRLEIPPTEATPENPLVALSQYTSPRHPYDSACYHARDPTRKTVLCDPDNLTDPDLEWFSIDAKGCAMTSAAMVSTYHGGIIGQDQGLIDFNDWLKANSGFDLRPGAVGNLDWRQAAAYRGAMSFIGFGGSDDLKLRQDICRYGPQAMNVKGGGHFVMVVGRTGLSSDTPWKIYDPNPKNLPREQLTTLAEADGGVYPGTRRFRGWRDAYPFPIYGIRFLLYSPAELLVTAPDGSKTGFDPITGRTYNEIPNSSYQLEGYDDAETGIINPDKVKILDITGVPSDGEYLVQVTGTGTGMYDLAITRIGNDARERDRIELIEVPVEYGEVHRYAVAYSAGASQPPAVSGGFDGRGQRPADVNKFLRYSNPSSARTSLPAGTTHFRLAISYGETTIPETFKATLNGADVSALFSPAPGVSQVVLLPLSRGSNTLVLAIDGRTEGGGVATDTDRLVFLVP